MTTVRHILQAGAWLLPASVAKNFVLRRLGHNVHSGARAAPNIVWKVAAIELRKGSRIGKWNVVKNMRRVCLAEHAMIGRMNLVSAHPAYVRLLPDGGVLELGAHGKIMSRHQLDCSARVDVGAFASMAGHESRVLTHSVDLRNNAQTATPVRIGDRSFVSSRCLILGGAALPARSVLAAGGVLVRGTRTESGMYAGVPARRIKAVEGAWFDRDKGETRRIVVDTPDGTVERTF